MIYLTETWLLQNAIRYRLLIHWPIHGQHDQWENDDSPILEVLKLHKLALLPNMLASIEGWCQLISRFQARLCWETTQFVTRPRKMRISRRNRRYRDNLVRFGKQLPSFWRVSISTTRTSWSLRPRSDALILCSINYPWKSGRDSRRRFTRLIRTYLDLSLSLLLFLYVFSAYHPR